MVRSSAFSRLFVWLVWSAGAEDGGWDVARRVEGKRWEIRVWRWLRWIPAAEVGRDRGWVFVLGSEGGMLDDLSWRISSS